MINNTLKEKSIKTAVESGCPDTIRRRFDILLEHNKLRQIDLANLLPVDKAYICRIVNGKEDPPFLMKLKIAQILKTDTGIIWK